MADEPMTDPTSAPSRLKLAAQTVRQTTKWILTITAGLGSVLIAGLRFGDLGHLAAWTPTFWIALAGVSVALTTVGFVLAMASRVLTVRYQTLRQVVAAQQAAEEGKPLMPAGVTSKLIQAIQREEDELYAGFADDPRDLLRQIRERDSARQTARATGLPPREQAEQNPLDELRKAADRTADYADYWETDRRYKLLLQSLPAAGAVIVIGVLTFTLAINRSAAPKVSLNQTPLPVEIIFSPTGQSWAEHALGCKPARLPGIAIGGTLDAAEVVVDDGLGCHASRFVVTSGRGIVIPTTSSTPASR
jgi:hypothetical protein